MLVHLRKKSGFTLVEMSIVLVVVALVAGGVIAGREMVIQAQIRGTVSQIEKINQSVAAFKVKYNCLPGDCPNARSFFTAASQPDYVQNGSGDSQINAVEFAANKWNDAAQNWRYCAGPGPNTAGVNTVGVLRVDNCTNGFYPAEWINAWDHLAAAGMAPEGISQFDETSATLAFGTQFPQLKSPVNRKSSNQGGIAFGYVPSVAAPYMAAGNKIIIGLCEDRTSRCGIDAWNAVSIDTKIDDGKPFSGRMVSLGWYNTYRTAYIWGYSHNGNETRGCGEAPEALLAGGNRYQSLSSWSALDGNRNHACALYVDMSI